MCGAAWFTDPELLLPLVAKRLMPGGVFAFARTEAAEDAYGPRAMGGKWLEGRDEELTVTRRQYPPQSRADLLKVHGLTP